jgi:hypothetical protein
MNIGGEGVRDKAKTGKIKSIIQMLAEPYP